MKYVLHAISRHHHPMQLSCAGLRICQSLRLPPYYTYKPRRRPLERLLLPIISTKCPPSTKRHLHSTAAATITSPAEPHHQSFTSSLFVPFSRHPASSFPTPLRLSRRASAIEVLWICLSPLDQPEGSVGIRSKACQTSTAVASRPRLDEL